MKLTWYGHSCFRVAFEINKVAKPTPDDHQTSGGAFPVVGGMMGEQSRGTAPDMERVSVLLDPFITGNPLLKDIDMRSVALDLDHIVVSHGHFDHIGDLVELAKSSDSVVTANSEICGWLQDHGVKNVNPMNTGGTVNLGSVKISLTLAHHSSSFQDDGKVVYLGDANGVVIEAYGQPTLYYAGDTDVFSDMALIDEFYKPKIGILPIGGRFTMCGRKAGFAVKKYFHFSHVLPCHYLTWSSIDQNAELFAAELAGSGVKLYAPKPGGTVEIN